MRLEKTLLSGILALVITSGGVIALKPARVRAANQSYQLAENWAQLPAGSTWGVMTAVGIDSKGNVYAFQRAEVGEKPGGLSSRILIFDNHGKFVGSWGEKLFPSGHGLRVSPDDFVWITDKVEDQVFKFTTDGKLLLTIGKKGVAGDNNSEDALNGPSDVVIGKNGDVFVSDGESTNTRVVKFSKDGKFIKCWGTKGSGPGQMDLPHDIAIDSDDRLYVADRKNNRVQVFDRDGKYVGQMTQFGTPVALYVSKDLLYVLTAPPDNRLTIATKDGKELERVEGLKDPHGMVVAADGTVYVAESGGNALLKFVKK